MIRWRLAELMARYDIPGTALAETLGVTPKAVSHIKRSKSMPKINGETLCKLCGALSELSKREITPYDLIEFEREESGLSA